MARKAATPTTRKKYSISLTEREGRLLQLYAESRGISRPAALHSLLKQQFKNLGEQQLQPHIKNQLGLFDVLQIDIFSNKTVETGTK